MSFSPRVSRRAPTPIIPSSYPLCSLSRNIGPNLLFFRSHFPLDILPTDTHSSTCRTSHSFSFMTHSFPPLELNSYELHLLSEFQSRAYIHYCTKTANGRECTWTILQASQVLSRRTFKTFRRAPSLRCFGTGTSFRAVAEQPQVSCVYTNAPPRQPGASNWAPPTFAT